MKKRYYSFDVFDTCLTRLCGTPRNLFDILAAKTFNSFEHSERESQRQMFVATRLCAQGNNLEDIYHNISQTIQLPLSVEEMIQAEIATERDMLVPIASTLLLVNKLRAKGEILFITDMYLPDSFIKEILEKNGFFQKGDTLYVSEAVGKRKMDGSLFQMIHSEKCIAYKDWHHYGDNRHSDFCIPRHLGIHSHLIKTRYLPHEKTWKEYPSLQFPYASIMAGISHALYLQSNAPSDLKAFVCDLTAPLMVSWVVSILEDALCQGIKRIYFCARDTHSEFLIAQILTKHHARYNGMGVHYLFVSTKSIESDLCLDYFVQEGLASKKEKVAIVDTRGRGFFINKINTIMNNGGYDSAYPFLLQLCYSEDCVQAEIANKNRMSVFHNIAYTRTSKNRSNAITDIGWMLENILSLNFHSKTMGYHLLSGKIIPIFQKGEPEIMVPNIRSCKQQQDNLLIQYAKAYSLCCLPEVNNIIISAIIAPTLSNFAFAPYKRYLKFLSKISLYGKNNTYVHSLFSLKKTITKGGHWAKGCVFFTFPRPVSICIDNVHRKIAKVIKHL